jgi:rod shape determining protein RodA
MGKVFKNFDWLMVIPFIVVEGFSLALLSSTANFLPQLLFFVLGLIIFIFFSLIDWRIYQGLAPFIYIFSILFLLLTFLGPAVRGANRWIDLFGFRWQPSELVKPLMILTFASYFSTNKPVNFKNIFFGFLLLFLPTFLIFRQPDLGNVIILLGIWLGIVYGAGLSFIFGLLGLAFFLLFLPLGWLMLKSYQKLRILSYLNPYFDPGGAGYNSIQAMIAVGSGQLLGRGLGQGPQSRLLFLPESHTDFIFALLVEESGFLGAILVLFAYSFLLWRILSITRSSRQECATLILLGIFTQIFLQVVINSGMNLGLLPITGITLPLLSLGGSSIVSTMMSLGIAANIYRNINKSRAIDISF